MLPPLGPLQGAGGDVGTPTQPEGQVPGDASELGRLAAAASADLPTLMEVTPTTLLTSLLVTTPVWRHMAPLPVLSTGGDPDGTGSPEDESMEAAENAEAELIFEEPRQAESLYPDIA